MRLETMAPPERIARIVDLVRAGDAHVHLLRAVADGRERELVTGRETERVGSRRGQSGLDRAGASGRRPVAGYERGVLLQAVVEAEDGQGVGGATLPLRHGVRVRRPAPIDGHTVSEHAVNAARHPVVCGARILQGDPSRHLEAGIARGRVRQGALEPAERDRLGIDRPSREQGGGQEHGDERSADDETI